MGENEDNKAGEGTDSANPIKPDGKSSIPIETRQGVYQIQLGTDGSSEGVLLYLAWIQLQRPENTQGFAHTATTLAIGMATIEELLRSLDNRNNTIGMRWPGLSGDELTHIAKSLRSAKAEWGSIMDKVGQYMAGLHKVYTDDSRIVVCREGEQVWPTVTAKEDKN